MKIASLLAYFIIILSVAFLQCSGATSPDPETIPSEDSTSKSKSVYYVCASGHDTNSGTSSEEAWRTTRRVNEHSLQPGDTVRFKGGEVFDGDGLFLGQNEAGSADDPVRIQSFGDGRATIRPTEDVPGVFIFNTAGIIVDGLILEGNGIHESSVDGILVYTDLPDNARLPYIRILNTDVHQFYQGIFLIAESTDATFSGFDDVLIENTRVYNSLHNGIHTLGQYPGSESDQSHTYVTIRSCEVFNVPGDPNLGDTVPHSGSGIIMAGVKGGLIDRCYAHNNGGDGDTDTHGGPVGIWTWGSDSVTIQRSLVHDQKTGPSNTDGGGFDIDGGATNAVLQYNYSYNNFGAGYLLAGFDGAPPLTNATVRYNISWGDGINPNGTMGAGIHLWKGNNTTLEDITIHNNLLYATGDSNAVVTYQSGDMPEIRFYNNVIVGENGVPLIDIDSNTNFFELKGNAYWAPKGDWADKWQWGGDRFDSLEEWRHATGNPETMDGAPVGLQIDPLIQSLTSGAQPTSVEEMLQMEAFRLLDNSPLHESGIDLTTDAGIHPGDTDFFGTELPQGKSLSMGVHEPVW